ncbi:MAG: hypothetical protein M1833_006913 [Piccolia ochrophora]|nr:MAG: hypothetical protein M1833_006913 [Piccolia ochrophora]
MAIWPFGRKGRLHGQHDGSVRRSDSVQLQGQGSKHSKIDASDTSGLDSGKRNSGRKEKRQKRRRSSKLTKSETESQEKALQESSRNISEKPPTTGTTDVTNAHTHSSQGETYYGETPQRRDDIPSYYFLNPMSNTSLTSEQRNSWQTPPTLRAKRSATDGGLPRSKSSKRKRRSDQAREEEIRSMSSPIPPKRPVTYNGGPIGSDSKKTRGTLKRPPQRPASETSLPQPESMHSSTSTASERRSFRVRSLDVLAPRPTIRYSDAPRYTQGPPSWVPSRSDSRRAQQPPIPEEALKQGKTIDNLADDLDAAALRDLMERDHRRKERKRKSDHERLQRRLQRRAEKQREDEMRERELGLRNIDQGFLDRETAEAGPSETHMTHQERLMARDPRKGNQNQSPVSWLRDPSMEHLHKDPFADQELETEGEASPPRSEVATSPDEQEEPVVATAQAVRLSQAGLSPPISPQDAVRPKSNISEATDLQRETNAGVSEPTDSDQVASDSGAQQLRRGSWIAFFRRSGTRNKRNSTEKGRQTPSDFSNTSRDSLPRQPPLVTPRHNIRRKSGTPVRTMSKFREDLPELPLSPPDSRLQSPETIPLAESTPGNSPTDRAASTLPEKGTAAADSVPAKNPFADAPSKNRAETPASHHRSSEAPSPENGVPSTVVSQSMASIDSEGSWLSGRPSKRTSQTPQFPLRNSAGSLQRRYQEFSDSGEELGLAEDEYFNRLTPGHEQQQQLGDRARNESSTALASGASDDGNEEQPNEKGTWHGGVGRQPTVVHHTARVKSREGLLNEFEEGRAPPDRPSMDGRSFDLPADDGSPLHEAASVDLGKQQHVRHVSAGSAKLLDIAPRSPTSQRLSAGSFREDVKF